MALPRRVPILLLLLVIGLGANACGKEEDASIEGTGIPGEAFREGLAEELDGLEYNVFITRQLNPKITPDQAFYKGPDPGAGQTLYGLFFQVCNREKEAATSVVPEKFTIKDSQGNEFKPQSVPSGNDFVYKSQELEPDECTPAAGSVAQQQSAAGALLLYKLPLENLENRPIELEIEGSYNLQRGERGKLDFELDF